MQEFPAGHKFKFSIRAMIAFMLCFLVFKFTFAAGNSCGNNTGFKDYGRYGHLFEIGEKSMVEEIMEKLARAEKEGKIAQLQKEFSDRVKTKMLRPVPVSHVKRAIISRSWSYDPSYRQETDIRDDKGGIIVAAGTRVNALEKLEWGKPLVFIDGDDKSQVNWAKSKTGKIILTNGAPLAVSDLLKRPIYFDQAGILCRKFKIEATPAIIEQDGMVLKVSEVAI